MNLEMLLIVLTIFHMENYQMEEIQDFFIQEKKKILVPGCIIMVQDIMILL